MKLSDVYNPDGLKQRFDAKVDRSSHPQGCWTWTASTNDDGYGWIGVTLISLGKGVVRHAHRVAYMLEHGEVPDDRKVLHGCDNPSCVNPDHLFLGTQQDNIADMVAKGRQSGTKPGQSREGWGYKLGSEHRDAKLTEEDVLSIRSRYAAGQRTQGQLAEEYGVVQTAISNIVRGKLWQHVGGPITNTGRGANWRR
jgi:hypothetical protein